MAFSRAFLKSLGLNEEQINAIIEEHTNSTDALKAQRDQYKTDAEKLQEVQTELDTLKAEGGNFESKYNSEHEAFENYKAEIAAKEARTAKESAYRTLLESAGVGAKYIDSVLKIADLDSITLEDSGEIKDSKTVAAAIKEQYSDFITAKTVQGVAVENPPASTGAATVTKEQFEKMGYMQRLELKNNSPDIYNSLKGE